MTSTPEIQQAGFEIPGIPEPIIPFTEHILKFSTRCNWQPRYDREGNFEGGCNYLPERVSLATGRHGCYEYANGDEWKQYPASMDADVYEQAALRIGEHSRDNGVEFTRLIVHGGEPLMRSAEDLEHFSSTMRDRINDFCPDTKVCFAIQTNGSFLANKKPGANEKLAVLLEYKYDIGLSMDGDREACDRHRRNQKGESVYDEIVETATKLRESGANWGIDCVIDTNNDPLVTVRSLASHKPGSIKFLLPHANHSVDKPQGKMPYGEWQIAIFDWYYDQQDECRVAMPIFESYMYTLLGGQSLHESVANRTVQELFYAANGAIQRLDTLKSTEMGAVATGMDVFQDTLDEVVRSDPGIIARRLGNAGLSQQCLGCPLLKPCGGGHYAHRFKASNHRLRTNDSPEVYAEAFRNPSVYCEDNNGPLINHIAWRMEQSLGLEPGALVRNLNTKVPRSGEAGS